MDVIIGIYDLNSGPRNRSGHVTGHGICHVMYTAMALGVVLFLLQVIQSK